MDLGLTDKVAVITGGASGLGRETAHYLVRDGVKVLIADINEKNIRMVVEECRELGGRAEGIVTDVRDYAACERMAEKAVSEFGSLDILLAGAGIAESKFFLDTHPSDWTAMLTININGVLNANRAVAPIMIAQKRG